MGPTKQTREPSQSLGGVLLSHQRPSNATPLVSTVIESLAVDPTSREYNRAMFSPMQ